MAGNAQASSDDVLTCGKCHGFVTVEPGGAGVTARIRCAACGHIQEVERPDGDDNGAWSVRGGDGTTRTFDSWDKLVSAARAPATREEAKKTGAALLDLTNAQASHPPATLTLAEDSDANLGNFVAKARAESAESSPSPSSEKAPVSAGGEELDSGALVEDTGDDEASPLSLRDAIEEEEEDEASPLSLRDAIIEDHGTSGAHETISLKDVVVVPGQGDLVDTRPPRPGTLRTLPPTKRGESLTPPPPTITFDDERAAAKQIDDDAPATKDAKQKPESSSTGPVSKSKAVSARASVAPRDDKKRAWVVPALVVGAAAVVIWRFVSSGTPTPEPQPTAVATAATTTTTTTADPTPSVPTSEEPSSTTTPTPATLAPTTTGPSLTPAPTEKKIAVLTPPSGTEPPPPTEKASPPPAAHDGLSMSELLDRAGSARRSGDYATARELYQRVIAQNPGNVEANGGLGDVARASGDLTSAKASYERALAASPSYGPAQLGLADTEWDLGNKGGAQRRYAQIVDRLGDRAPERAKERGTAAAE